MTPSEAGVGPSAVAGRLAAVRERIARAAARAGRKESDVTLVAVSKTNPAERVREAFAAGQPVFGENKVQEAEGKIASLADLRPSGLRFHLVGHLQSNKARKAASLFDLIHSVDSVDLGRRLAQASAEQARTLEVLVQLDLALEPTKHGLPEAELETALEALRGLPSLRVKGLMILPPLEEDAEKTRPFFRRLREIRDRARRAGLLAGGELSMGMSHDFEVAIEEGATLVRVGTAIFGERAARPQ
jgi:pyridoxal phosphate enzyme (YggS family)